MTRDAWGKKPRRPKQKRDSWAKPKRGRRHKKEFGAIPKKDRKKLAKSWGKPERGKAHKVLEGFGGSGHKSGGILSKIFRPSRGVSLNKYYAKLDQLQASQIQAGVREQLAEAYQDRIDRVDTLSEKLTRFVEGILRRRLSPGQMDQIKGLTKEVISPSRVVAFVTNLFK